jgi:hypothetical protein
MEDWLLIQNFYPLLLGTLFPAYALAAFTKESTPSMNAAVTVSKYIHP